MGPPAWAATAPVYVSAVIDVAGRAEALHLLTAQPTRAAGIMRAAVEASQGIRWYKCLVYSSLRYVRADTQVIVTPAEPRTER